MSEAARVVKFALEEGIGPAPRRRKKHWKRRSTEAGKWRENQKKIRNRRRVAQWIWRYKAEHPCACGESDPSCLDFHHVGEKNREMSHAPTMTAMLKELPFCVVKCANCHRKIHARDKLEDQPKLL